MYKRQGVIFAVKDISGLDQISINASGDTYLAPYYGNVRVGATGVIHEDYALDVQGKGLRVGGSGTVLTRASAPAVTTDTLYNVGGSLYFDGSTVGGSSLTAGSGIAIVDNKVHFESKSSGGKVLSSIKGDNDNHVTLMVSGTIVTNPADAARPGMVVIGSGAIGGYDNNVVIGKGASAGYTNNVVIGKDSKSLYWEGLNSVSIGIGCTSYSNGVAIGYQAQNKADTSVAIGLNTMGGREGVAIGRECGWNSSNGVRYGVAIGHRAQNSSSNKDHITAVSYTHLTLPTNREV